MKIDASKRAVPPPAKQKIPIKIDTSKRAVALLWLVSFAGALAMEEDTDRYLFVAGVNFHEYLLLWQGGDGTAQAALAQG